MTILKQRQRQRTLADFNPALPADGSLVVAGELRDQFNGLATLIAAITSVNAAVVDEVTTLPPGDPAAAGVSVSGSTLHFTFDIPRGAEGPEGPAFGSAVVDATTTLQAGESAQASAVLVGDTLHFTFGIPQGYDGSEGAPGPPFAQAVVDGVYTLPPGDPATVEVSFDGTEVHFTFSIPAGDEGPEGPPGEVSLQQLEDAISGTSNNSNEVNLLNMTVGDPPTQAEVQMIADKMDELINALRRG